MRIGIISDIHGNYVALRKVLEHMGEIDSLWCLGDLVGYGPQPNECIEAIREYPHLCIPGNHDWGMLGRLDIELFNRDARKVLEWTYKKSLEAERDLPGRPAGQVEGLRAVFHYGTRFTSRPHVGVSAGPLRCG